MFNLYYIDEYIALHKRKIDMKAENFDRFLNLGKENAEALAKAGQAYVNGFSQLAKLAQSITASQAELGYGALSAALACRSACALTASVSTRDAM